MTDKIQRFIQEMNEETMDALRRLAPFGQPTPDALVFLLDDGSRVGADRKPVVGVFSRATLREFEQGAFTIDVEVDLGPSAQFPLQFFPPASPVERLAAMLLADVRAEIDRVAPPGEILCIAKVGDEVGYGSITLAQR